MRAGMGIKGDLAKGLGIIVLCVTIIVVTFAALTINWNPKNSTQEDLAFQQNLNQTIQTGNASDIALLNEEIAELKKQILQLEAKIEQAETENTQLKEKTRYWENAFDQLTNELRSLEKIEEIRLLVEKLRTEPPPDISP